MKKGEATGYEISWHSGHRPEHTFGGKQYTFREMETLGINRMLNDYNCYHWKFPVIVGEMPPEKSAEELRRLEALEKVRHEFNGRLYTLYELKQLQNRYRREMEKTLSKVLAWQTVGNEDMIDEMVWRLSSNTDRYLDLSDFIDDARHRMKDMQVDANGEEIVVLSMMFDPSVARYEYRGRQSTVEELRKALLVYERYVERFTQRVEHYTRLHERTGRNQRNIDHELSRLQEWTDRYENLEKMINGISGSTKGDLAGGELKPLVPQSLVPQQQLIDMGFRNITNNMITELNETLRKNNILSANEIAHFLAQCSYESMWGQSLTEAGWLSRERQLEYLRTQRYYPFYGAGYIQLTWESNYRAFSEAMNDPLILSEGPEYVAANYAWQAAGWWWTHNNMNQHIANGATVSDVTQRVSNSRATASERQARYDEIYAILTG